MIFASQEPSALAATSCASISTWTTGGRPGAGRVDLHVDEPTREITLHAVELDIKSATIAGGLPMEGVSYDEEAQTTTLRFGGEVSAGDHTLDLEWTGPIPGRAARSLPHVPRRREVRRHPVRSDRRPPSISVLRRAGVQGSLLDRARPRPGLTAIGNAPIERTEQLTDGRTLTRFAETPPISTYLVAFTVGPYESTEQVTSRTGVPVRVWLPPGLADKGDFARDVHASSVAWLEDYTAIPYPYGKLDAIGLPDFEAGAMENPGAITYRTHAPGSRSA